MNQPEFIKHKIIVPHITLIHIHTWSRCSSMMETSSKKQNRRMDEFRNWWFNCILSFLSFSFFSLSLSISKQRSLALSTPRISDTIHDLNNNWQCSCVYWKLNLSSAKMCFINLKGFSPPSHSYLWFSSEGTAQEQSYLFLILDDLTVWNEGIVSHVVTWHE